MATPIIWSGTESSAPLAHFAKKESVVVPASVQREMAVQIPYIYYWEDVVNGQSVLMTMAFRIHGLRFGLSYPIEDTNAVKLDILRKKLFQVVKESLDALVHHGTAVLDSGGNINPRLVYDQEAIRFKFDQYWPQKVAAFNKLVKIMPITKRKAEQLGLLSRPPVT